MITLYNNQRANFKFVFSSDLNVYNPLSLATPKEIIISIFRGDGTSGPVIDGPYSSTQQDSEVNKDSYISDNVYDEIVFTYRIPMSLYEGIYTVQASVEGPDGSILRNYSSFQVVNTESYLSPVSLANNTSSIVNYRPEYKQLARTNHSTLLLIGHADGVELNQPFRVKTIQHAIDTLKADFNSPLLRGILNAYAAGATDIVACAAAPMYEYIDDFNYRLRSGNVFDYQGNLTNKTFYQRYYERLEQTYFAIRELDFIDIIAPLQASIIRTGDYDFITQLAQYCYDFNNETGFVQMGVIGSRTNGFNSSDIELMEQNSVLVNKLTTYSNGFISSDIGRFVVPVYGECLYSHPQIRYTYTDSVCASYAAMLASNGLGSSLIRKRIPGAVSVFGSDLSHSQYMRLEDLGVNTIYRGKKTKRNIDFEVYVTNDYTLARTGNTLHKAQQMRLMARLINETKVYASQAIGRLSYDSTSEKIKKMLDGLLSDGAINDYSFNVTVDSLNIGHLIFDIEVLSSLGLKKIDFSLSAGPGA
jgi:hypothetical protein